MFGIFRLIFSRAGGWQSHERADAVQPGLVRCCEPLVSSGPQWLHCFSADLGLLQTWPTGSDVRRCRANILFWFLSIVNCIFCRQTEDTETETESLCLLPLPPAAASVSDTSRISTENAESQTYLDSLKKCRSRYNLAPRLDLLTANCCIFYSWSTQTRRKAGSDVKVPPGYVESRTGNATIVARMYCLKSMSGVNLPPLHRELWPLACWPAANSQTVCCNYSLASHNLQFSARWPQLSDRSWMWTRWGVSFCIVK